MTLACCSRCCSLGLNLRRWCNALCSPYNHQSFIRRLVWPVSQYPVSIFLYFNHIFTATKRILTFHYMFQKPEACNFVKKETLAQVLSYEFCENSKNTYGRLFLKSFIIISVGDRVNGMLENLFLQKF